MTAYRRGDVVLVPFDFTDRRLLRPSLAQTKLATIEAAIIGRKLGALTSADLAAFERGLRAALDLV